MSQLGFDFGVEPRRLLRVTPARLTAFGDCPRRYRMAYVDRPQPRRTGAWAHSTLGAVVHNALRALFGLPAPRRTAERAAALVGEHWSDAGFADEIQAARYRARAREWVADYVETHDVAADPVGLERWVSARVNARTGGSHDPSLLIEGRADRIDQRDGELVVVDYKTGRRAPGEVDARESMALALYAVAAERTLRKPCHTVELHHLPSGTIAAAEHSADDLRDALGRAESTAESADRSAAELAEGGDADLLFPAVAAPRCGFCEFRPSCEPGQQASTQTMPWDLLAPLEKSTV